MKPSLIEKYDNHTTSLFNITLLLIILKTSLVFFFKDGNLLLEYIHLVVKYSILFSSCVFLLLAKSLGSLKSVEELNAKAIIKTAEAELAKQQTEQEQIKLSREKMEARQAEKLALENRDNDFKQKLRSIR